MIRQLWWLFLLAAKELVVLSIQFVFLLFALICFVLSATRFVTDPLRLMAVGLAFLTASMIAWP